MRRIFFLCVLGTFLVPTSGSSFDHEDTHRELTSRGILSSSVDAYLKANLNLPQGILTEMGDNSVGKLPHEPPSNLGNWLREGSYLEDELHPCRAINHFHNPRRDWTESGMRDQPWFVDARCTATEYPPWSTRSAIPWATDYTEPSPNGAREETTNQWNWDRAREYFNIYLTGKNYANQGVAITESARDSYLASSFQALGQVLHLLQDMAVPAHVRDDFRSHLEVNGITPSTIAEGNVWIERFEYFVMKKPGIISGDPVRPNLQNPSLTSFWDTNQYTGQDPEVLNSRTLGLAEYANINFPSKNTIFTEDYLADSDPANDVYYHPYPRKSSTNINDFLAMSLLPVMVTAEDGISDSRFYITKSGDGEVIEHFLGAGFFARHVLAVPNYNPRILSMTLERDDECLRNHAEKLLPRAVGYSAALLNYFFRGKIEITETRFGYNPTTRTMDTLTLRAWNVTENAETMTNGTIDVVIKYKNLYEQDYHHTVSRIAGASSIPRDEPAEFVVNLTAPLPIDTAEAQVFVIFKGMLGLESGGIGVGFKNDVIGTLFAEEWDNGLIGNHPWEHESGGHGSGSGAASNTVSDGILWKSNLRYVGQSGECVNESYLSLADEDGANPLGILVRPDTFVHFSIPRMAINQIPPAPSGATTNWQAFNLMFNNGYMIQFSRPGQLKDYGPKTAYYYFDPSIMIMENIYDLFQGAGISVSEPLYLETIDFIQQLLHLEEPSNIAHHQEMEVEYIRIIGGK